MLDSYIVPTLDEGFNNITILDKTIYDNILQNDIKFKK